MVYTNTIRYFTDPTLFDGEKYVFDAKAGGRLKIDPDSPVYARGARDFNQREFMYPAPPIFLGQVDINVPEESVFALRLLIKQPGSPFIVPEKILFLKDFITSCATYQQAFFPSYEERFVYLTVRSGPVMTSRDDEFHVDGFQGTSVPRHIPEQNYLWADSYPTLFSLQPYFVEDMDASKHNFHEWFNRQTDRTFVHAGLDKGLYVVDPYHVHARQPLPGNITRTVIRLTFSPVEIRDDSNTVNPWLPRGPYGRNDVRNHLWSYHVQEPEMKFGLRRYYVPAE